MASAVGSVPLSRSRGPTDRGRRRDDDGDFHELGLAAIALTRLRDVVRGRLDARLDWRQTIALADLPESLVDTTYQVVRQTRLWRNEKVNVANDLVAHFQDGLAFGHSPEDLLRTFGDPQAAEQLIRRAKQRDRALFWHVGRYGLIALAALVGANI